MRWIWLAVALMGCGSTASDTQVPKDFTGIEVVIETESGVVTHFCEDSGDTLRQWVTHENEDKESWQLTCEWQTSEYAVVQLYQHEESPAIEAGPVGSDHDFYLLIRGDAQTVYESMLGHDVEMTLTEWDPDALRLAGIIEGSNDIATTTVTFGVTVENYHR